jgi:hypothetical protein
MFIFEKSCSRTLDKRFLLNKFPPTEKLTVKVSIYCPIPTSFNHSKQTISSVKFEPTEGVVPLEKGAPLADLGKTDIAQGMYRYITMLHLTFSRDLSTLTFPGRRGSAKLLTWLWLKKTSSCFSKLGETVTTNPLGSNSSDLIINN